MADLIFEDPRLVAIYDHFDGNRDDLTHYLDIIKELKVNSILDVGCGTGSLVHLLCKKGYDVFGLEPAKASLDMAMNKFSSTKIKWIHGDTSSMPELSVDLVTMTANVAQVFVTDESWDSNLININKASKDNGYLVFETRDPSAKAWLGWNKENTYQRINIPMIGYVEEWCDLIDVSKEQVSFRWNYVFESDGETFASDSTLRFRSKDDIIKSLKKAGYLVNEVRDAPDRPGKEFVFIAKKEI